MNVKYMYSLLAVVVLSLGAYILVNAGTGSKVLFGIIVPYAAVIAFLAGFVARVRDWMRSPVPFRITTTCGQQESLPWIEPNRIDNPFSKWAVVVRMALEILFFRSLFRNTRLKLQSGPKIAYNLEIFLWIGALAFHYAFLVTILRHLRFFTEPVPGLIQLLERADGFFRLEVLYDMVQAGLPGVYLSGIVLLLAVLYLFLRRVFIPSVRYISLAADFFPLFLIFTIALTGILMRYVSKIDVTAAKELAMGLVTFHPTIPAGVAPIFYVHLFLVSILLAYFPFSKLMHMGGVFLSPTRNLTADTRRTRHVNPWNYPVPVHTYDEYEDEFREKMVEAGLPVEKAPEAAAEAATDEADKKE